MSQSTESELKEKYLDLLSQQFDSLKNLQQKLLI